MLFGRLREKLSESYKNLNDIALVQKIFGHRTQLDTLRYIGIEQEYIDNAAVSLVL